MLAIARPERSLVLNGSGRDERVGYFETMAPGVLTKKLSGKLTGFVISLRTRQQAKAKSNRSVLLWSSALPDFSSSYRRKQDVHLGCDQCSPVRENGLVPGAKNLDYDIGINDNAQSSPSRFRRVPFRKFRTYVSVSGRSVRSFQSPTIPSIATRRSSWLLKYRSRAALRTRSDTVVFSLRARVCSARHSSSSR
jgi:hypothetical protein